jgi:chromosome partitioning protein
VKETYMAQFTLTACQLKGGVGRSTALFSLAGEFVKRGYSTLCLDCDPQASLSQILLGPEAVRACPPEETVASIFDERLMPDPARLIRPTELDGLAVVPGSYDITRHNHATPEQSDLLHEGVRDFVAEVGGRADIVLIDTPPSLQGLTWAAAVAADAAFTPLLAEPLASQELGRVQEFLARVTARRNPRLKWVGLVVTMYQPRLSLHSAYLEGLRDAYGELVCATCIPYAAAFKECVVAGKPLPLWKPRTAGAKAIAALADELLSRITRTDTVKEAA